MTVCCQVYIWVSKSDVDTFWNFRRVTGKCRESHVLGLICIQNKWKIKKEYLEITRGRLKMRRSLVWMYKKVRHLYKNGCCSTYFEELCYLCIMLIVIDHENKPVAPHNWWQWGLIHHHQHQHHLELDRLHLRSSCTTKYLHSVFLWDNLVGKMVQNTQMSLMWWKHSHANTNTGVLNPLLNIATLLAPM